MEKINYIFLTEIDGRVYPGEIAPNIRFNETPELIEAEFNSFLKGKRTGFSSAFTCGLNMSKWFQENPIKTEIQSKTSFSMAIMEPSKIKKYLENHNQFKSFKMKVDKESAIDSIKEYFKWTNKDLRIDGNEAWSDPSDVMKLVELFKDKPISLLEQPFAQGHDDCLIELKSHIPWDLIADESFQMGENIDEIKAKYNGVNLKMMKTAGPQRLLELVDLCKKAKLKLMIGCMIETSVGISCALQLAHHFDYHDLDGSLLVREPFGFVRNIGDQIISEDNLSFFKEKRSYGIK